MPGHFKITAHTISNANSIVCIAVHIKNEHFIAIVYGKYSAIGVLIRLKLAIGLTFFFLFSFLAENRKTVYFGCVRYCIDTSMTICNGATFQYKYSALFTLILFASSGQLLLLCC